MMTVLYFCDQVPFFFLEFSLAALNLHAGYIQVSIIAQGIKLSKFQNSDPTATDSKVLRTVTI